MIQFCLCHFFITNYWAWDPRALISDGVGLVGRLGFAGWVWSFLMNWSAGGLVRILLFEMGQGIGGRWDVDLRRCSRVRFKGMQQQQEGAVGLWKDGEYKNQLT